MVRATLVALVVLGPLALSLAPADALPLFGCPVASLSGFLQNDAGSGRDAGDTAVDAVPFLQEGHSWANLDAPLTTGFLDEHDWFRLDVPPGLHTVRTKVAFLPNFFYGDDAVPYFYFLEIWEAGGTQPVHETISYLPPTTFEVAGGPLWFHVFVAPLLIAPVCSPPVGSPLPDLGLLPAELGQYGVLADCTPDCLQA